MKREWKPGTVLGDASGRVLYAIEVTSNSIAAAKSGQAWEEGSSIIEPDGNGWNERHFDDLRPLVVIDPEDREQVERLYRLYASAEPEKGRQGSDFLAYALREFANPTPPKPDEPMGLGAVVEDAEGRRYARYDSGDAQPWWWDAGGADVPVVRRYHYADFDAVRVLSEGVS